MDTICNNSSSVTLNDNNPQDDKTFNDDKPSNQEHNNDSNSLINKHELAIKVKRCKHGRIIVKDPTKKKSCNTTLHIDHQQHNSDMKRLSDKQVSLRENDDADAVQNNSIKSNETIVESKLDAKRISPIIDESNDLLVDTKPSKVESNNYKSDTGNSADPSKYKNQIRSPKTRYRSRTPSRTRRRKSNSPKRRSSPRRERTSANFRSPRESKSPRRFSPGLSPLSHRNSSSRKKRIGRKNKRRSPRRKYSPTSPDDYRDTSKIRSSPKSLARSPRRSSPKTRSPITNAQRFNTTRYPSNYGGSIKDNYRRDQASTHSSNCNVPIRRPIIRSDDTYDELSHQKLSDSSKQSQVEPQSNDRQYIDDFQANRPRIDVQDSSQSLNQNNQERLSEKHNSPESEPMDTSPQMSHSARSPLSISGNESAASDIYDPEGPIIPISPGDSPPLSPMYKAAHQEATYTKNIEKTDDDVPSSAVQLNQQEKYLQKLNRQERVIEEVKVALKPFYQKRAIDKEQYKDVLRRAVPKVCHSKNGEINPVKIQALVEAYVKKMKHRK